MTPGYFNPTTPGTGFGSYGTPATRFGVTPGPSTPTGYDQYNDGNIYTFTF